MGIQGAHFHDEPATLRDYLIFGLILVAIFLGATIFQSVWGRPGNLEWMRAFMGIFFVVFGWFKLLDLRDFAYSYANYDLIARRWLGYGYLYPFIELALGYAFLAHFRPEATNGVTLTLMTIGSAGVIKELRKGSKIKCACLGTFVKLPLSTVSLVEDLGMGLMAAFILANLV